MFNLIKNVAEKLYKNSDNQQNVQSMTLSQNDILTTQCHVTVVSTVKNSCMLKDKCCLTTDATRENYKNIRCNFWESVTFFLLSKIRNIIKMSDNDILTKLPYIYKYIYIGGIHTPLIYISIYKDVTPVTHPKKNQKKFWEIIFSVKNSVTDLMKNSAGLSDSQNMITCGGHHAV